MDWKLTRRTAIAGASAAAAVGMVAVGSRLAGSSAGGQARSPTEPVPVAFLLDENATVIDFSGPWEVLQDAGMANVPGFELFTVAPNTNVFRATGGLQIKPDYSLADAPPARVIIVPAQKGGRDPTQGQEKIAWLRSRYPSADVIMSVCTGAFILARTGLLDGLEATTHHDFLADFRSQFPKVRTLPSTRFVDNGRLITSGGLSSGIEAALHLVERFYGADARTTVAQYMEYVPQHWTA